MSLTNYGNLPIELKIDYYNNYDYVKNQNKLNLLDNFNLNYKTQDKNDVKILLNIMNNYSIEDKINIAKKYDDILVHFLERYFILKPFNYEEYNKILIDTKNIQKIVNYFVIYYKLHYNAPRPFQIANIYNEELNPVNLLSANTPSFPSGHSALYYAFYLYFKKIDENNNYEDILRNGRLSRIISGVHFLQDDKEAINLVNEIFKREK